MNKTMILSKGMGTRLLKTTVTIYSLIALFSMGVVAQDKIALSYPLDNIILDGSFDDWPEALPAYSLNHYYGDLDGSAEEDKVFFRSGYNASKHQLFFAVTVMDDRNVAASQANSGNFDEAILYLSKNDQVLGGAPFYFVASQGNLAIVKNQTLWDEQAGNVSEEDVQVEMNHLGDRIQYEWKVTLDKKLEPLISFGIDHFIIRNDQKKETVTNILWTDGFGKSMSSNRMGDLILVDENTEFGTLRGRIDQSNLAGEERIREIGIQSKNWTELHVKIEVDSNGYFSCDLPVGHYEIRPSQYYTSFVYSSGFKQNTRKLTYLNLKPVVISTADMTDVEDIVVEIIPRPVLGQKQGVLLSKQDVDIQEVDQMVQVWKAYLEIPAVSIALIKDGELIYDRCFGQKNRLSKEFTKTNTLFEAASITKSVFAFMVLGLAEEGIIDLDKPLLEYLPFPNIAHDPNAKLLTARIILGHQSGLPNWAWGGPGTWESGDTISLSFKPGTAFGYSGEAFNYLGRVIEHLTQKSLQQIFEEKVAIPFDLQNSHFYFTDNQRPYMSQGHYQQYPNFKTRERVPSPASSMSTNAKDFSKFVFGVMNEQGLSRESYELIYSPYTELTVDQKIYDPQFAQHVSHGFFVQTTPKKRMIGHGGNNGDFDCKYAYDPERKLAYVIFTNSNLGDEFIRQMELFLLQE